jgi:Flp pilus assembly protein TadB
MSALPVLFAVFVRTFNPGYFDALLRDRTGFMILLTAGGLWLIGMVLLLKLSKVDV